MSEGNSRLTRWGGAKARFAEIAGHKLDTIITGHLTQEQIDAYQQLFRIEEISDLLRRSTGPGKLISKLLPSAKIQNFFHEPEQAPQYDQYGNRTNTREAILLELLEKERHTLVEMAVNAIHNYDPPADYNKPAKTSEKLYIPSKDYPDINFVGLLLGPRGNTLRQLQEDSGAKLAIRGKGSVKDGKLSDPLGRGPEDDLHVVITADTTAKITKAIKLTNQVIEKAILSPVGQNDLKRDQLRELAVLNGTLRETKPFVPPEIFNQRKPMGRDVTLIVCRICGNVGHYSRDCKMRETDLYSPEAGGARDNYGGRESLGADRDAYGIGSGRGGQSNGYTNGNGRDMYGEPHGQSSVSTPPSDLPPWKRQKIDLYTPPPPSLSSFGGAPSHLAHTDSYTPRSATPQRASPPGLSAPPAGPPGPPGPSSLARPPPPVSLPPPPGSIPPPPLNVKPPPPVSAKPPPPDVKPPPPPSGAPAGAPGGKSGTNSGKPAPPPPPA